MYIIFATYLQSATSVSNDWVFILPYRFFIKLWRFWVFISSHSTASSLKVQEVPCSNAKELLVAGPILHILPSEPVQLLAPAKLAIPVILGEDIPKFPDYSATDVRIFCRTSEDDEREWNEVTEQLKDIAVLENGTVTFTVNHFSE